MEGSSLVSDEGQRSTRIRKKNAEPIVCPICGVTIRLNELDQHLAIEMDRLQKTSNAASTTRSKKTNERSVHIFTANPGPSTSAAAVPEPQHRTMDDQEAATSSQAATVSPNKPKENGSESSWTTYEKIKSNRQARLKIKTRKRKAIAIVCPVCNKPTSEEINRHLEECLKHSDKRQRRDSSDGNGLPNGNNDYGDTDDDSDEEDDSIDICAADTAVEEYEWAGQTRIRASSLLAAGSYASLGLVPSTTTTGDTEEFLNVDGDDTQVYGPAQYIENDVIPPENTYLRSLVIGDSSSQAVRRPLPDEWDDKQLSQEDATNDDLPMIDTRDQVLDALKAKIKEYELSSLRNKCKCQICMDEYKSPAVSISCWHVHCEECWLKTLGVRKLCPKCNTITSPADLRRIYL